MPTSDNVAPIPMHHLPREMLLTLRAMITDALNYRDPDALIAARAPIPEHLSAAATARPFYGSRYPVAEMAVGESFTVAANTVSERERAFRYIINRKARRHGVQCSIEREGDNYRVWRTA